MVCGPHQIRGPSAIPFWTTCYDVNSDMGAYLTSKNPNFQAELSDPNFVWRQFGKAPKDAAGRQRLATEGPSLTEQLQASLNALHPLLGKDEVAQTLFAEGTKMLGVLRQTLPETKALEAAIKSKTGDVLKAYGPKLSNQAMGLLFSEKNKQQLLTAVGALTAPLAVKYGGLQRALESSISAGALAGATTLIAGVWNGWVQEQLGRQMNEMHATSGQLSDHVAGPPYEDYFPGDWVAMRTLRDMVWHPHIGLVTHGSKGHDDKYWRFRVAVLPTSDIVYRDAADLALIDQQKMAQAIKLDPKLEVWRAAMAVKDDALRRPPVNPHPGWLITHEVPPPHPNSAAAAAIADRNAGFIKRAGRGRRLVATADDEEEDVDIGTPDMSMGNVDAIEGTIRSTVVDEMRAILMDPYNFDLVGGVSSGFMSELNAEGVQEEFERYKVRKRAHDLEESLEVLNTGMWADVDGEWVALTGKDDNDDLYFRTHAGWQAVGDRETTTSDPRALRTPLPVTRRPTVVSFADEVIRPRADSDISEMGGGNVQSGTEERAFSRVTQRPTREGPAPVKPGVNSNTIFVLMGVVFLLALLGYVVL